MRLHTIGCVELNSIAVGMHTADEMLKAADVQLVMARPTCPGRFIIVVTGDVGAVESSVSVGRTIGCDMVVDEFLIPSVHPDVLPALTGTSISSSIQALGVIETYTTAACILAADAAAKSGSVALLEIRTASGLAGKAFVTMTGDVASVEASVNAGVTGVGESGPVFSHVVLPSPSEELKDTLL